MKKRYIIALCFLILIMVFYVGNLTGAYTYDIRFAKKVQKVKQATGVATVKLPNGQFSPLGTAFLVDKNGYFLTANHVFLTAPQVVEKFCEYNNISFEHEVSNEIYLHIKSILGSQKIFKTDPINNKNLADKDILLFEAVDFNLDLTPLEIAKAEEVKYQGMEIGFVGFTIIDKPSPDYSFFSVKGTLSNLGTNLHSQRIYAISAITTNGFSGGAVFLSKNGKVIGLVKGGGGDETGKTGITYVPPVHEVPQIIKELKINGS